MGKKITLNTIRESKGNTPLCVITAYDALFARLFADSADIILVGDSLNMSFAGKDDTLSTTLDQMIYHAQAVNQGAPDTFTICDMPFGTYSDTKSAIKNSIRVYQETSCDAIKIEGGVEKAKIVQALTDEGIAVCGHIGLLPQSVRGDGGYRVRGKSEADVMKLVDDIGAIEEAGAFCAVIEGVKSEATVIVGESTKLPLIGIGAGNSVDAQVLVFSDLLGLYEPFVPKFVKKYADGASITKDALKRFREEVQNRSFPSKEQCY